MNNIKTHTALIIFLILTAGVWIIWPAADKFLDTGNYENRTLREFPDFNPEQMESYLSEVEQWLDDRAPFRNQLIRMNGMLDYYLFDTSPNSNVIKGKDGWLFYNNKADGDPIASYKGEDLLTEDELASIAKTLCISRDNLASEGCDFIIYIAPNKERIYADELPDYYGDPADEHAALQIYSYLKTHTDIKIVYPLTEMIDASQLYTDEYVYHKTDTHWNEMGAYTGMLSLLETVGITMPFIESDGMTIVAQKDTPGDLANMLNLGKSIDGGMTYRANGYLTHGIVNEKWDFYNEIIYHTDNGDPRRVFVWRDSFGSAMSDIIGSQFSYTYLRNAGSYDNSQVKENKPDIFVLETVERYAAWRLRQFLYE